jgi:two-component system phosphate regulon sensor histidine kinase PhoR
LWRRGRLRVGIRLKLFFVSFALIVLSVAVADAYLTRNVATQVTDTIRNDLFVRAELVERQAETFPAPLEDIAAWDEFADGAARVAEARVTIIRRDGVVIGDSGVAADQVASIENHGTRPEVVAALAQGRGAESRLSATIQQRLLYVAVPMRRHGDVVGVARVAKPLSAVEDAIWSVRRLILIGSGLALLIAVVMSSYASHRVTRVVRRLTTTARDMTSGDLEVRSRVTGSDELAELGHALDQLAGSLSSTVAELRTERDLLGRVLEGMHEGVLVADGDGRLVMVNGALRAMLLLGGDAIGKLVIEVIRDAKLHELLTEARGAEGVAQAEVELPGIKPRRVLVQAAPFAGEDHGVLAVFVDVTELRRLEALRRDFVANVSHELRTPLTAVRSAAETLRDAARDDPRAVVKFVDTIERNAERLQNLIDDLLELSRLESREFRLKKEPTDIGGVVQIVLGMFRDRAEKKGVTLGADVAFRPKLETDQRAVEQVLNNLVDNAIKYCPSGASVTVSTSQSGDRVEISVVDTGPGIERHHLPRLFERFYRIDAGRSRDVGGTGLGLSIVKHLVEALGGKVSVESEIGKGSTFAVLLPCER